MAGEVYHLFVQIQKSYSSHITKSSFDLSMVANIKSRKYKYAFFS
jgi:hypothetical protein